MNMIKKLSLVIFLLLPSLSRAEGEADLLIFSYNRPLQLYALLESVEKYIIGLRDINVVYRADEAYADEYQELRQRFSQAHFIKQGEKPREDFKPLVLHALSGSTSNYLMIAVDDIIVTDFLDCRVCTAAMEQYDAYAFYLRLGFNTTRCYPFNSCEQGVPPLQKMEEGIYRWRFNTGQYDWAYPHSNDLTIFRMSTVRHYFERMYYDAPYLLESAWANHAGPIMGRYGLCFEASKMVNLPLNLVQHDCPNRHSGTYSPEDLLAIFNQGKKIDISTLYQLRNESAHINYDPTFVAR